MGKQFSLAHLTVLGCTPPEMIHIAARSGYDFVSLRLIPMGVSGEPPCLPEDKAMMRQTQAALEETGLKPLDIELARIIPDIQPQTYLPAMEAAAQLGARHLISSAWTQSRDDCDFVVQRYGEICDLAHPFGLTVELEFPTFSRLTNLEQAVDIVRKADRPNGGILIDTLYLYLSQVGLDELETLPPEWLHFLHISDTCEGIPDTREGLVHIARDERLYLGEGCIDFADIFERLPDIPLSIELPNAKRVKELGYEGHARRCLETAKRYMDQHCAAVKGLDI
ncbi:MAG: sugar phosphate isomerase/epimerase [Desulfosarcinaceae bacterium]